MKYSFKKAIFHEYHPWKQDQTWYWKGSLYFEKYIQLLCQKPGLTEEHSRLADAIHYIINIENFPCHA